MIAGKYCIYKKDTECPSGLTSGYVIWDDDDFFNLNKKFGTLPYGTFEDDTEIHFCCRTDGDQNEPIILPSKTPFYLLAHGSAACQMVKWAIVTLEWIHYDTENWRNEDDRGGAYPYDASKAHPTIYYCYYHGE